MTRALANTIVVVVVAGVVVAVAGCPPPPPPPVDAGQAGAAVHVVKGGDGHGTLKSVPEGIDCDALCDSDDATFGPDVTTTTLHAEAARDALFDSWNCGGPKDGAPLTTQVVQSPDVVPFTDDDPAGIDVTCTATFRQLWTILIIFSHPNEPADNAGTGTITGSADGDPGHKRIECPDKCTAGYFNGESETLTPTPDPGFVFVKWKAGCDGTGPFALTLTSDVNCEAV